VHIKIYQKRKKKKKGGKKEKVSVEEEETEGGQERQQGEYSSKTAANTPNGFRNGERKRKVNRMEKAMEAVGKRKVIRTTGTGGGGVKVS